MSNEIVTALIGAAASIVAAWGAALINARRLEQKNGNAKQKGVVGMRVSSVATKWWFVWLVAPLTGALLWFGGARVTAGSLPLKAPCCVDGNFYPSGYMGDGQHHPDRIQINTGWKDNCHTAPCIKVSYVPGPDGWAGVYWQYPDKNFGEKPGRELKGAKKLVFWARGEKGGEIVSFKVGGINQLEHKDSLEASLGPVELTTEWKEFEIDLTGADTSSVIGAFAWIASKDGNPQGLTFYLDDICFK